MPKSRSEVRQQLSAIEPDETIYEGIGPAEVDLLKSLLDDEEHWLAARAVHALSSIAADSARDAVVATADSLRMAVRVAAATSVDALPPNLSDDVLSKLISDPQVAVRKFAIKSVSARNNDVLKQHVLDIATTDKDPRLQQVADERVRSMSLR